MKRNFWPYAIISYFVVFVTGIITWVSFAMRHDDQLVRPDYYEHEIKYQDQIDRIARTARGKTSITYNRDAQSLFIQLAELADTNLTGSVHLYRPSDARLDQKIPLNPDSNATQTIDVSHFEPGFWKVRLNWKLLGTEYYAEKPIVLYPK